ncbi:DsbA family protein [Enemella sp. A6]|uniref:DsbA family protein n=1 Tax=Enemella sp. A6 TaxID=3440152 RepID=UPI003EB8385A
MSKKTRANKQLKRAGTPSPGGANARERARLQAQAEKRKKDRMTLIIAGVVVVALLVGGGVLFSWFLSTRSPEAAPSEFKEEPQALAMNKPIVFGKQDAPKTISVWADFQCPHCAEFEKQYGDIIEKAVVGGEWKLESWPMAFLSAGSVSSANAYGCAAEEGFAWSYQKALFENANLQWNNDQLVQLAEKVNGSAPETFTSCVQNMEKGQWGESINATSRSMGISSTPTVHINGEPFDLQGLTKEKMAETLGVEP